MLDGLLATSLTTQRKLDIVICGRSGSLFYELLLMTVLMIPMTAGINTNIISNLSTIP